MKTAYLKKNLFIVILLITQLGFSQLSKTHYIPPLTAASEGNAYPENQYFYISTPSEQDVAFTIERIGLTPDSYSVSKSSPQEIFIDTDYAQLFITPKSTSQVLKSRGFIIEAEEPIYVSVRMEAGGAQAGALVSKGSSALGTEFRIGAYTNETGHSGNNPPITPNDKNYLSFLSVMATENNTVVTFSDISNDTEIINRTKQFPYSETLKKGESYTIAMNSYSDVYPKNNKDGLIGALIESDKPIVVNCGSTNGSFNNGTGRDYGIDQIVGADKIGNEYIFVRGFGDDGWENVLIVAHYDNTEIYINGSSTAAKTINAGEYHLIEGDKYSAEGNMYVKTSQNVFAYQGVGGLNQSGNPSDANQGLFFVPSLSCETKGNIDNIPNINKIGNEIYNGGVSIVTKKNTSVTINNQPINSFNSQGPFDVPGNSNYETYKVIGLSGSISVECDDELYCAYFNYNGSATTGGFYSGFLTAPEINFDADFTTLGNCIDNITLESANMAAFESVEWYYDDGNGGGFIPTGNNTATIKPTFPSDSPFSTGTYKLVGLTCTGEEIHSQEVPVSICPDDTDNDGIIDNIDIDNDNDGILNCTESYGDNAISLVNPLNGTLPNGSYTFIGNINPVGSTTNSIIGDVEGNFKSDVSSKNGLIESSITYTIDFNKDLNLLFKLPSSTSLGGGNLTNEQEFIIKVPNNKTITLIDPDDQLLIDIGYNGVYESGITQFSSFEIRFKIKGTSLAPSAATFKFMSSMVSSFTYTHKNISDTNNNTAIFKIKATCLPLDSDNDGINDDFDYDSDNDGIPDIVEGTGTLKVLSKNDSNNDGLDDIFNISALPLDTDNDTVFDYLDLDSDNDGIYDLIETGQLGLLSDTDLNGIIDWLSPTDTNGWDDNAETSPDSGIIGYTLNDLDGDLIFSYIDSDSDGDVCHDVIEAGFTDSDADGFIDGTGFDLNGVVIGSDGYTLPNANYLIAARIDITKQPETIEICELTTAEFYIETTATIFQWQVSTDGVNWTAITNNVTYQNATTKTLSIINIPLNFNNYQYRIQLNSIGNSCDYFSDEVILTVNPLPIIVSSVALTQCDDDTNDGKSLFNLTEANLLIVPTITTEVVSYFTNKTAAESVIPDTNFLIDASNAISYEAIDGSVVYARVETASGCYLVSEVNLIVEPTQLSPLFQEYFTKCDDYIDASQNDRDGIATFDFSSVTNQIYAELNTDATRVSVTYYENQQDALTEESAVDPSNYRNTSYPILTPTTSHQIYVRIDSNNENACIGLGPHVNLTVEALPYANPVTITRQCDDNTDGIYPFDTSQIESTVIGNQSNVIVSYFDELGNPLLSPLPNPFLTENQTITIRVTNNSTSACFDETTLAFIVDKAPVANPVVIAPVCDDESNDGFYDFDTSTIENTILGNQTGMGVRYFDALGNELPSPLPNPFSTNSQTITATVVNSTNTNCSANTSFDFIVNPIPNFEVNSPQTLCITEPASSIQLNIIYDTNESFTFNWKDKDGNSLSTDHYLDVSAPGNYFITLSKTNDALCSNTKEIIVISSIKPTITQNDVIVEESNGNNTVTINTANLGVGDYEFALDDEFNYQDQPYFDDVEAGFHTVFARDKNGCGSSQVEITVIGFPKFFTPNGDGKNDTWQVLGLNEIFYPNAKIYIFDRFGKLITQISPNSNGWDGMYNNEPMPSTDYWFTVQLTNSLDKPTIKKGHFSLIR